MSTSYVSEAGTPAPGSVAPRPPRLPDGEPAVRAAGARPTVRLFGYDLLAADLDTAVEHLLELAEGDEASYVVTMNVDHVVELAENERFRRAYRDADVRVADGTPVVLTARALGQPLPARVTGADLMPRLLAEAEARGHRVAIVGGEEEVNAEALRVLRRRHPDLDVWGSSPFGFVNDPERARQVAEDVAAVDARIVFVCFGAPRSEIWIAEHRHLLPPGVALCAGAGVDFLAGAKRRAPAVMQRLGLEWLFRLLVEPRRLWRRYLVRDLAFVPIAAREIARGRRRGSPPA